MFFGPHFKLAGPQSVPTQEFFSLAFKLKTQGLFAELQLTEATQQELH